MLVEVQCDKFIKHGEIRKPIQPAPLRRLCIFSKVKVTKSVAIRKSAQSQLRYPVRDPQFLQLSAVGKEMITDGAGKILREPHCL